MTTLRDKEFGDITVRRSGLSHRISIRVAPNGTLRASAPPYAPMFLIRRLVENSRGELRNLLGNRTQNSTFAHGMMLGKSHVLVVETSQAGKTSVQRQQRQLIVALADTDSLDTPHVQQAVRNEYIKILRKEARAYLPRRLMSLGKTHGFRYNKVRYSHASGRWGSCSSTGTISLNIALMKLPHELIDYVLIHELCHTQEMNHSREFWRLVEAYCPDYKQMRRQLKAQHPYV